jgi:dTDP-4-dehydrorhamnose 3,5-epimerase
MNVIPTALPGLLVVEPRIFRDERGLFFESYHEERYRSLGIAARFVQDNQSHSLRGVLRGLHYQLGRPQAKLVQCLSGEVFDVAVDIRRGSPTFGRWVGEMLSAENRKQLFIPEGFAHGFYVVSEAADFHYKCSDFYAPAEERGIRWDDPDLAIAWPQGPRMVHARDAAFPLLRDAAGQLPGYVAANGIGVK